MWAHLGKIMPRPWLVRKGIAAWLARALRERRSCPCVGAGGEEEEGRQQQTSTESRDLSCRVLLEAQDGTNQQG